MGTGKSYGQLLSDALYTYRHGGRSARMQDKLERVVDDAERLLAELNDEEDDGLDAVEKRTLRVCNEIPEIEGHLPRPLVHRAIEETVGDSEYKLNKYEERVKDRWDLTDHPDPDVNYLVPESEVTDIAYENGLPHPDLPPIRRKHYRDLDREEKVGSLRGEMAIRAANRGSKLAKYMEEIHADIFDGHGSHNHIKSIAEEAGEAPGFEFTTFSVSGKPSLVVYPTQIDYDTKVYVDAWQFDRQWQREREQNTSASAGGSARAATDGGTGG